MIDNEEQLQQTQAAIGNLESALAALKRDVLPRNRARFNLMAEPIVDELRVLRKDVDDFVGVSRAFDQQVVEARGILRQIDLDDRTFTVRDPDTQTEVRCTILPEDENLLELAKASLDHPVLISGTRLVDPTRHQVFPLQAREIEVLELADAEETNR